MARTDFTEAVDELEYYCTIVDGDMMRHGGRSVCDMGDEDIVIDKVNDDFQLEYRGDGINTKLTNPNVKAVSDRSRILSAQKHEDSIFISK